VDGLGERTGPGAREEDGGVVVAPPHADAISAAAAASAPNVRILIDEAYGGSGDPGCRDRAQFNPEVSVSEGVSPKARLNEAVK
jgi:hypothetical protein